MPMAQVIQRTEKTELIPLFPGCYAPERPVNLAPSTTFAAGTVLGIAGVAANEVQLLTTTGTPTGGSQTWRFYDPISGDTSDFTVAYNAAVADTQAAIRAAIGNADVTVSGSGAQPGNAHTFTFSGRYASLPIALMTLVTNALTGGTSSAGAVTRTTLGRTANTYAAYVGGGATDPAKCLLRHACVTDAAGYVSYGATAWSGGDVLQPATPAFFGGVFLTTDLTGLDAGAIVDLGGKLESGTAASGVLRF